MYHHLAQHAFGLVVGGLHAGIAYKREQVSLLPMYISISFILFITSLRIVSDGSEDAVTSQRARHGNAAARIAPFRIKCAKHSFTEGPIHRLDYDKDVFTCIQTRRMASVMSMELTFISGNTVKFMSARFFY